MQSGEVCTPNQCSWSCFRVVAGARCDAWLYLVSRLELTFVPKCCLYISREVRGNMQRGGLALHPKHLSQWLLTRIL